MTDFVHRRFGYECAAVHVLEQNLRLGLGLGSRTVWNRSSQTGKSLMPIIRYE